MASFSQLDAILEKQSYLGHVAHATWKDYRECKAISASDIDCQQFPHLWRWHGHILGLIAIYGNFDRYGNPLPDEAAALAEHAASSNSARQQKEVVAKQDVPSKKKPGAKAAAGENKAAQKQKGAVTDDRLTRLTHFCVLDFEKTCDTPQQLNPQEIIEFPSVLVSHEAADVIDSFEQYVKPTRNPNLTPFCTELTRITQEQVDSGIALQDAIARHHGWLRRAVPDPDGCIFVTCGNMDLKTSLPEDPNVDDEHVPGCYKRWLNIKDEFALFYSDWYKKGKQPGNMTEMLDRLEITSVGHHHSGIDDCRNIAQVLQRMIREGWRPQKLKERVP